MAYFSAKRRSLLSNGAVETEGAHLKDLIGSGVVDATVNAGRDGVATYSDTAGLAVARRIKNGEDA